MQMQASDWIALVSAAVAGFSVWHSYRVEKRLTADERCVFGPPKHPDLREHEHQRSVLCVAVVNLGRRRAIVTEVSAVDARNLPIEVSWSNEIDDCGNPLRRLDLFAIESEAILYVRRDDGVSFEEGTVLTIRHSQSRTPNVLTFQGLSGWGRFLGSEQ